MDLIEQFPTLRFFEYEQLPEHLRAASKPFRERAYEVAEEAASLPKNNPGRPEAEACLRNLLQAKDARVRVAVERHALRSTTTDSGTVKTKN